MPQTTTSAKREEAAGRGMGRTLWRLAREEQGQGAVEYALIILLIAVALVAGLGTFQATLTGAFAWISSSVASAAS